MNNSMRKERQTYSDKLLNTTNWKEVIKMENDNNFFAPIYMGKELENFPDTIHDPEDREKFEELCDIIEMLLTKQELTIWNLIINENYSFRKVGDELKLSHETIRKIFKITKFKLQEALDNTKE